MAPSGRPRANETGVPLWTISRGKNNGYGGPEARDPDSVILDLHRMDRIIEVNDELGYAILEPGVTFFALAEYIRENNLKVWPSVPSLGWGSVVGNTLDRGWGYTPMGDHSNQQCGMEVVLPDGDLVRTGMSAITDSPAGPIFKGGYGPGLDGLFFQSNLGIVTQMGIWLLPRPDAFFAGSVITNDESMLPVLIDVLADLRRKDILQNNLVVGNPVRSAANVSPRSRWFDGEGALPVEAIEAIKHDLGIGEWNARFGLYGDREMILRRYEIIKERFKDLPGFTVTGEIFEGADGTVPSDIAEQHRNVQAGHPGYYGLQCVKFRGENGGAHRLRSDHSGGRCRGGGVLPGEPAHHRRFPRVPQARCAHRDDHLQSGLGRRPPALRSRIPRARRRGQALRLLGVSRPYRLHGPGR
jgi:4-cresol dehydrogenase (hydroxylating)